MEVQVTEVDLRIWDKAPNLICTAPSKFHNVAQIWGAVPNIEQNFLLLYAFGLAKGLLFMIGEAVAIKCAAFARLLLTIMMSDDFVASQYNDLPPILLMKQIKLDESARH